MLTLHRADLVLPVTAPALEDGAVAVQDGRIAATGPYAELAAANPTARTRAWHGILTPGLCNPHGRWLLEHTYHPDPREADQLGTEPITGAALDALGLDDSRWGASARRGLQRMLRHGTTALAGPFERPTVRFAVARSGLTVVAAPDTDCGEPTLNVLRDGLDGVVHGSLTPGARADLAVFEVPLDGDPAISLREHGAASCLATVLAGRLVHRRR